MKNFLLFLFLGMTVGLHGQYHVYADLTNLVSPRIIETNDGNYLMLTYEDCYTPGAITIEGCMYAIYLIKTDIHGDTIWTSRVGFNGGVNDLYENQDGTFTIIGTAHESWHCENIGVGLYGFSQIQVINLDQFGRKINRVAFPDECALQMRDVKRVSDKLFVVLAEYSKPIYIDDQAEERMFLMDNNGTILNQIEFPANEIIVARLFVESPNIIQYFYSDTSNILHLKSLNLQLQVLDESVNTTLQDSCFLRSPNNFSFGWANNGDLIITCVPGSSSKYNFFRFSGDLTLKAHSITTTLLYPKNFVETNTGSFIVVSTDPGITDQKNTKISYHDADGNLTSSYIVHAPDIEFPTDMIQTSTNELVIVGGFNCCNLETTIGPGKSFLLLGNELPTSSSDLQKNSSIHVFPNPASDRINIEFSDRIGSDGSYDFQLYTILGKKILLKPLKSPAAFVSLDGLPSGIYIFNILDDQSLVLSGKLVKQ